MLNDDQRRRFARHLVLPEIGASGQTKLLNSSILIVGCGGLGAAVAGYLAAMGIGRLGLVDPDRVELSNLQRQILFEEADIGQPKVNAAKTRLQECCSAIHIDTYGQALDDENAASLISNYDVVVDATDNFKTRITLHDASMNAKKPLIYAAISGFEALLTTFKSYLGDPHPCLHCFMPDMPEREINCAQEGIVGALAGMIGSQQALEALKEILQIGESLSGRISRYQGLSGKTTLSSLHRDPDCSFCDK